MLETPGPIDQTPETPGSGKNPNPIRWVEASLSSVTLFEKAPIVCKSLSPSSPFEQLFIVTCVESGRHCVSFVIQCSVACNSFCHYHHHHHLL